MNDKLVAPLFSLDIFGIIRQRLARTPHPTCKIQIFQAGQHGTSARSFPGERQSLPWARIRTKGGEYQPAFRKVCPSLPGFVPLLRIDPPPWP